MRPLLMHACVEHSVDKTDAAAGAVAVGQSACMLDWSFALKCLRLFLRTW